MIPQSIKTQSSAELIDSIEASNFQCEAGPLHLSVEWQEAKNRLEKMEKAIKPAVTEEPEEVVEFSHKNLAAQLRGRKEELKRQEASVPESVVYSIDRQIECVNIILEQLDPET